ncbi:dnaJ homolog subfamily C member 30, mitochondrial-like [Poeciliopsis prolifica]|uniref:dnaJ homolog subfamily C member 30, mitochondrial-like n=1 Tax=Poeciliopsis prolifica TaxID=188132 RepID=UPI0024134BDB|nr:dnaJ homolog subfamily C member 30, mitochondrial-like [Poeciliopsis prolifica]
MAEVRYCVGRGECEFGLKMSKLYLLQNRIRLGTKAAPRGSLSAWFQFDNNENRERSGAGRAALRAAAARRRDGYPKLSPLPGGAQTGPERDTPACFLGHKSNLCSHGTLIDFTKRTVPPYRTLSPFPPNRSLDLDPGSPPTVFIRSYSGNGSRSDPLYKTKTGYYDVLDVPPTATKAQIKTAYYKQSFACHPDRNPGSAEATDRFSEISEAYTVLGNQVLRKKYDLGLLSPSDLSGRGKPASGVSTAGSTGGSAQQQPGRRSALTDRHFDFDEFYKAHYGEQLLRDRDTRLRREERLKREESHQDTKFDNMIEFGIGLMLLLVMGIIFSLEK